ncbi:MAG: thioesterase family protein [Acidimicrobiales bacterium]
MNDTQPPQAHPPLQHPTLGTDGPAFAELLEVLQLDRVGPSRFRARSPHDRTRSIFGGQLIAQALVAAGHTAEHGRLVHSMHAYFLRPGDPALPLDIEVEAIRDGRAYQHRQAVVSQGGKEVLRLLAGFVVPQDGAAFQVPVAVGEADPAGFTDYIGWTLDGSRTPDHPWGEESRPVALRYEGAPPPEVGQRIERPLRIWCRLHDRVDSDDPILHAALLAWISDKTLADLTVLVHGYRWMDPGVSSLSLDHAMWYAGRVRADGWLLFEQEVLQTASQRGLVQGAFVSPTGQRLATACQEALVGLPDAAG